MSHYDSTDDENSSIIDAPTMQIPQVFDCHLQQGSARDVLEDDQALKAACQVKDKFFQALRAKAKKTHGGPESRLPTKTLSSSSYTAEDVKTAGKIAKSIVHVYQDLSRLWARPSSIDYSTLHKLSLKAGPKSRASKKARLSYTNGGSTVANYCTQTYYDNCPKPLLLLIECDPERALLISIAALTIRTRFADKKLDYFGAWPSTEVIQIVSKHTSRPGPGLPAVVDVDSEALQQVFYDNPRSHPFIGSYREVRNYIRKYDNCGNKHAASLSTILTLDLLSKEYQTGNENRHIRCVSFLLAARRGPLAIRREFEEKETAVAKRFTYHEYGKQEQPAVTSDILKKGHDHLVIGVVNAVAVYGLDQFSKFTIDQRYRYWESLWRVCPFGVTTTVESAFCRYVNFRAIFDEKAETDQEQRRMWRLWYLSKFKWDCEQVYQHYILDRQFPKPNETIKERLNDFYTDGWREFPDLVATEIRDFGFRRVPMRHPPWKETHQNFLYMGLYYDTDNEDSVWRPYREIRS